MHRLRILIADDHPAFRRGLASMLSTVVDLEVIADVADGRQAVARARELRPDLVLMDLHMPVMSGIEATATLTAELADIPVLVLTMVEDPDAVLAAVQAGANGYLLKGADQDEIVRSVRAAAAGELIFGPGIAARARQLMTAPLSASPGADHFPQLTTREVEVLDLLASGLRNPQIADRLFLSEKTVRNHVSNIFAKLHADRSTAIILAREAGLGKP